MFQATKEGAEATRSTAIWNIHTFQTANEGMIPAHFAGLLR